MITINEKINYIREGKKIINDNPFYYTLNLLIKYYFVQQQDFYLMTFIEDVTSSENEFKVFMVFKEFALYTYQTQLLNLFNKSEDSIEDICFIIIAYIKKLYDEDRNIIQPYITTLSEHENEVISKFNLIKSLYNFKEDSTNKMEKLNQAILYIEKSRELEQESKKYSDMALNILKNLRDNFKKTIKNNTSNNLLQLENLSINK
jgi:hypothetical protein